MRKLALPDEILLKYPAACPLHRRRGEHVREGPERCGHPLCHVLPGRVRWVRCQFI